MTTTAAPIGVITLLTDFGLADPFVGVMKGVILSRFPQASIVDLCHGVQPQAVIEAAFWLERCYPWFPAGSVHVAVVDPGVGSERRLLAVAAGGHYFLLPDNGILTPAMLSQPDAEVRAIDLARLGLRAQSATFHGRDLFAPLAAGLASGQLAFEALGAVAEPLPCALPAPRREALLLRGEVVTVDRFGNLITNLDARAWPGHTPLHVTVLQRRLPVRRTYSDAGARELLGLVNSFGVLEIACRDGSAEHCLGLGRGTPVELALAPVGHGAL